MTLREYQDSLVERYGFCAACLGNLNSSISYEAHWTRNGEDETDYCKYPVGTQLLIWTMEHYYNAEYLAWFTWGPSTKVLIPIAISMGTPLCEPCNYAFGIHSRESIARIKGYAR